MRALPRVLLVTRRFWPLASDSIWRMLNLAAGLRTVGCSVDVLTAAWHSSWPEMVSLREINLYRIGPSPTTPFRSRRYARALSEWINKKQSQYDCIIMDSLDDDALLVAGRGSSELPVILRHDSMDGLSSIGPLAERAKQRTLSAVKLAGQVVVPHEHALRELIASDVRSDHVTVIADGPGQRIERNLTERAAARRALADINHELFLRGDDRLCVCLTELVNSSHVEFLVRTIGPLLEKRHDLKCWILGDGPLRSRIYELLKHEGWKHEILMPGTFESPDLVVAAADLCLVPSPLHGASWIAPTALASGLTTLAADSASMRARLGNSAAELLYNHGDSHQLSELIQRWCRGSAILHEATCRAGRYLLGGPDPIEAWNTIVQSVTNRLSSR